MKAVTWVVALALMGSLTVRADAAEHRVEALAESAPTDVVAEPIATLLAPEGMRVIRGTSRTICDIWICKQWPVKDFEASGDVIYPFTPGQLIGVIRYSRKGADFRGQEIAAGVYTMRYAQQPVDGAHVGTSPTRDFLLLQPAADDTSAAPIEYKQLVELSNQASGTTHPALLSLQRTEGNEPIREQAEREWWLVRLEGSLVKDSDVRKLAIDLVVVGQAE